MPVEYYVRIHLRSNVMQNKASPRLLRLSFHPKDELGIPEGLLGSFSIFVVFTVTENIPTQIPSTKTHYGKECICQRITDILDKTGAHWSKTQSRRNICKGRKILVWHNLPASRWKLKTVCNISLRLNPISREAPDAGGGGSSKEVSTQWKPSEVCSAIRGCRARPVTSSGLQRFLRGKPTHLPSWRWPGLQAGGAPGRGSRSARAQAWPGRASVRRRGVCTRLAAAAGFHSALRSACLFRDQVVLSTLLPDSVLTGREPVFQGVTHL